MAFWAIGLGIITGIISQGLGFLSLRPGRERLRPWLILPKLFISFLALVIAATDSMASLIGCAIGLLTVLFVSALVLYLRNRR